MTRRIIRFSSATVCLLVLLTSLCVLAQAQSAAKPAPSDPPATGAITGKVVDDRGQPLFGVEVRARVIGVAQQRQLFASTDREGAFRINGLEPGAYALTAWLPAYVNAPADAPPSTYHPGDSANLTLIKGGVITGTVTNFAGEPLVAIAVSAPMLRDAGGRRIFSSASRPTYTDDRGVYRFYGLAAGTYLVMAGGSNQYTYNVTPYDKDAPTYAPSSNRDTAEEISVRSGEEVAGVDIRYRAEQGHVVSGKVAAMAEPTAFNVTLMSAIDTGAPWSSSQYQPPNNRSFSIDGVADGDYVLVAELYGQSASRPALATKRITVRGADVTGVELVPKPFSSVSGRVVLEDSKAPECAGKPRLPMKEILVSAWHNDNEAAKQLPSFVWSVGAPVAPDTDGNFTMRNLLPAEYYFTARHTAKYWYLQSILLTPAAVAGAKVAPPKPVDVTRVWTNVKPGDKLTGVTITLAQGAASLQGQLVLHEGEQVPAKLVAYLVPAEREKAEDVLRYFAGPVSPDGKIALNNIAPGRYWITTQTVTDDTVSPLAKLRLPLETETRARLRRDAEAAKTAIEFKPCQNVTDFQLR